jgi:hypothetical protein
LSVVSVSLERPFVAGGSCVYAICILAGHRLRFGLSRVKEDDVLQGHLSVLCHKLSVVVPHSVFDLFPVALLLLSLPLVLIGVFLEDPVDAALALRPRLFLLLIAEVEFRVCYLHS